MKTTWFIGVASDLAVVGYNPESADMDRPNGEIIREVFYLRATNDRGDAREYGSYRSPEAAEAAIPGAPMVFLWNEGLECEARERQAEQWGFDTRFGAF